MARSPDRHPGRGHCRNGPGPNFALALLLLVGACASTDGIAPLAATGDPARGREVFVSREGGHCVLCHRAPGVTPAGNVGPPLGGIGSRLDPAQLRARVADITRVYPESVMPTFHRTEGMKRVAAAYAGKPVLDARQVEDLVAWLGTLR
jgi:sulfur-oxidizing protein SoxX